jgi:hypothetical protein
VRAVGEGGDGEGSRGEYRRQDDDHSWHVAKASFDGIDTIVSVTGLVLMLPASLVA